ncbi:hypothetical protein N0V90_006894 [Kalmusia sp. IMI 367209]|nr:hypothetical protein N0V90_006894 [Kalmusia sp. IMI 367209]
MDPLSIVSGIIAVLSASGKTLEGLEKIWGLRHRDKHFRELSGTVSCLSVSLDRLDDSEQIKGLQVLSRSVGLALEHIQRSRIEVQNIRNCLDDIERLCGETTAIFTAIDRLVEEIKPKNALKPKKSSWIYRKSELTRLKGQAKDAVDSMTNTVLILIGLQSSTAFDMLRRNVALEGIDRILSGMHLGRDNSANVQLYDNFGIIEKGRDQQCFSELHLIILQLSSKDLETVLKNDQTEVNSQDANGRTPLLWASWRGNIGNVIMLLKYGADINKVDHESFSPLARASQAGHLAVVQILLTEKASIDATTSWGHQPIHLASENKLNGHNVVDELLEWGANANAYSNDTGTPLHHAANRGSIKTIKLLLDHGVLIDAIGLNGSTAAMVALSCWNEPAFFQLANAGARLDIVSNSGYNIIQLAIWTASIKTWDLIIERAENHTLGHINVSALHNGHDIEQCFHGCRNLWFLGDRAKVHLERAKFKRMIEACGLQRPNQFRFGDCF